MKNTKSTVFVLSATQLTEALSFLCAGVEIEGSSSFGDVSFPNEEQGVVADPNQQLYFPKPLL